MARVYDARLAEREWLAGELSVADLALYPVIAAGQKAIAKAGELPHLARWTERMAARPGVRQAYTA